MLKQVAIVTSQSEQVIFAYQPATKRAALNAQPEVQELVDDLPIRDLLVTICRIELNDAAIYACTYIRGANWA